MSINSAMLAGVSGLIANSSALAAISDNIANVNTVGYKRSTSNFSTLVTSGSKNQTYSAGGVKAQTHQFISQQGLTQSTTSNLDLSISGSGFFVATEKPEGLTATDTRSFTRAGSFQLDSLGYLRNDAGLYLQGWLADPVTGMITPDPSDLMQLSSINVGTVGGTAEKTTRVGVNANLRSEQPVAAAVSYKVGTAGSASFTGVPDSATPSKNHDFDVVYSSTGVANPVGTPSQNQYQVDIKENGVIVATGIVGYDATSGALLSSTLDYKGASPVVGSTTTVRINGTDTVQLSDLGIVGNTPADTDAKAGKLYDPSTWSMSDYAKDNSKGVKPDFEIQIPLSDSKGGQRTVTLSLLKAPGPNQWYAELRAKPGDLANNGNGLISSGIVEFTTDGKLKDTGNLFGTSSPTSISIAASGTAVDPLNPNAPIWADGLGIDTQDVQIDLASAAGGLTQYNSQSVVQSVNTNGTAFGNLTNIEVDEDGYVSAIFDNGVTRRIAQVAVATFSNPNGLKGVNGNAYRVTNESGTYSLKAPGSGGAGSLAPSTLEASTVDLSTEFTGLITTQRAYSASSKIITTADQMLEELLNIKR
ncbi:flagellar hook protein FlgE [Caulobacter sp.]|uniref:flagellar hook protein FlgE n=1 Tax=Caulobacter sp. TaxID=78 RepID=UPI001B25F727|nr:flagellar hook protein FlgE [Caulobacter sp.]MBO9543366.1 flagellar hook protein FlgE [Caulobacter sp.]